MGKRTGSLIVPGRARSFRIPATRYPLHAVAVCCKLSDGV
jgi:hypothetical protein